MSKAPLATLMPQTVAYESFRDLYWPDWRKQSATVKAQVLNAHLRAAFEAGWDNGGWLPIAAAVKMELVSTSDNPKEVHLWVPRYGVSSGFIFRHKDGNGTSKRPGSLFAEASQARGFPEPEWFRPVPKGPYGKKKWNRTRRKEK